MPKGEGYDYKPDVSNKFLTLKVGDTKKIRLVSAPLHKDTYWLKRGKNWIVKDTPDHEEFEGETPAKREMFVWKALDLADEEPVVKVLKAPVSVYFRIIDLNEDEEWGDPLTYNIKIEVTGEVQNYYKVTPLPNGKGEPLNEDQQKAVDESKIDLTEELKGGKETRTFGGGAEELETVDEEGQISEEDLDKIDQEIEGKKDETKK